MRRFAPLIASLLLTPLGCSDSAVRDVTWSAVVSLDREADVIADGEDEVVVTLRLTQSTGRSMKDVVVEAGVDGDGVVLDWPGKSDAQGVVVGRLSSTLAGVKTLSFVVHVDGPTRIEAQPTVSFVDAPGVRLSFVASPASTTAGETLTASRVVVLDRLDRIATSGEGTVEVELVADDAEAELHGTTSCEMENGECVFDGLSIVRAGVGYRLEASAAGFESAGSDAFDIGVGPVSAGRSSVVAIIDEALADGVAAARVRVTLRDAFDNPVSGVSPLAELSPAEPGDSVESFAPTDASGGTESDVSARRTGVRTVEVTAGGVVLDDHPTLVFRLTLDGRAEGVRGDGLIVRLESGGVTEDLPIAASGPFAFEHRFDDDDDWSVSIVGASPEQVCRVTVAEGQMAERFVRPTVRCGRRWMDVAEGNRFTVGLTEDGALWVWGHLTYDPYDLEGVTSSSTPVQLAVDETFVRVAAGTVHALAIDSGGSLWAWGFNGAHQVGDGTNVTRLQPVRVGPSDTRFVDVAAGRQHSLALAEDGSVWGWGWNAWGQVGDGTSVNVATPVVVANSVFKAIAAGDIHSLAVLENGALQGWGSNGYGALGTQDVGESVLAPSPVEVFDVVSVTAGTNYSLVVKTDGTLWGFGSNRAAALSPGVEESVLPPVRLGPSDARFARASAGSSHVLAVDDEGTLWSWGAGTYGRLGRAGASEVPGRVGNGFKKAAAGSSGSSGIRADGSLWTWGQGGRGHAGDGTTFKKLLPRRIGDGFADVFAGESASYARATDGRLWSFGANESGQLGDATTVTRSTPTLVGDGFQTVATGRGGALGLKTDGSLWGWGDNPSGRLGSEVGPDVLEPAPLLVGERFKSIAAEKTSLAVRADGTLLAWGEGPVGDGTSEPRATPVELGGGYAQVASAYGSSLALNDEGQVFAWGKYLLGETASTTRLTPGPVDFGGVRIVTLAASYFTGYALDENGRLWAWGQLAYDPSGESSETPVEVELALPVRAVAGGGNHALALLDDGSVWGWGHNKCGQLDADFNAPRTKVRPIELPGDVVSVAAGADFSLAVTSDGGLWSWGCNISGQLGIGSSAFEPLFVAQTD